MTILPKHVAVIMDGNGRWAQAHGHPRIYGHTVGTEKVEEIIRAAADTGIRYLTLYAFSKENWQRPKAEVNFLMSLLSSYLDKKAQLFITEGLVFRTIGRTEDLPKPIREKMGRLAEQTRHHKGMTVIFAVSYSSRLEIADACRKIACDVRDGKLKAEDITEKTVAGYLDTADIPDPDLLIRTSGEMRISNYLLWQISYAELYFTEKYWPEFGREDFMKALEEYQNRERRFGKTEAQAGAAAIAARQSAAKKPHGEGER